MTWPSAKMRSALGGSFLRLRCIRSARPRWSRIVTCLIRHSPGRADQIRRTVDFCGQLYLSAIKGLLGGLRAFPALPGHQPRLVPSDLGRRKAVGIRSDQRHPARGTLPADRSVVRGRHAQLLLLRRVPHRHPDEADRHPERDRLQPRPTDHDGSPGQRHVRAGQGPRKALGPARCFLVGAASVIRMMTSGNLVVASRLVSSLRKTVPRKGDFVHWF